mmetsp:Transcript_25014/g.58024  ORF Transcript_25014/g.58024 Transcript_25014/m.58024 type:complete len:240 (+) Transcript_25014:121-840(+)
MASWRAAPSLRPAPSPSGQPVPSGRPVPSERPTWRRRRDCQSQVATEAPGPEPWRAVLWVRPAWAPRPSPQGRAPASSRQGPSGPQASERAWRRRRRSCRGRTPWAPGQAYRHRLGRRGSSAWLEPALGPLPSRQGPAWALGPWRRVPGPAWAWAQPAWAQPAWAPGPWRQARAREPLRPAWRRRRSCPGRGASAAPAGPGPSSRRREPSSGPSCAPPEPQLEERSWPPSPPFCRRPCS